MNLASSKKLRMNAVDESVREKLIVKSGKAKSRFDLTSHMPSFKTGQKVSLHVPRSIKGKCPKLQQDWKGPYIIRTKINDVVYWTQKGFREKLKIAHLDRLTPYEK